MPRGVATRVRAAFAAYLFVHCTVLAGEFVPGGARKLTVSDRCTNGTKASIFNVLPRVTLRRVVDRV